MFCNVITSNKLSKEQTLSDGTNHRKNVERASHCQIAKISLYLQNQVTLKTPY